MCPVAVHSNNLQANQVGVESSSLDDLFEKLMRRNESELKDEEHKSVRDAFAGSKHENSKLFSQKNEHWQAKCQINPSFVTQADGSEHFLSHLD